MEKIMAMGAEAVLIKKNNEIIKRRVKKGYRHPELDDKIRTRRTRSEAKIISKLNSIIDTPDMISADELKKEIKMKFISGKKLSEYLEDLAEKERENALKMIGKNIALMHEHGIIHGDLTTSNMILSVGKVYFIDFGLSFHSQKKEDKAVDIHLLKQALQSKHFKNWEIYLEAIIQSYKKNYSEAESVLTQFKKVESRGRYKGKH